MHWPRQHGLIAAGRPACVCRGSVGRFLAGGSFARALLLLGHGGLVGAKAVQRPCSRTRPEPAPPEFPGESRCASALHRGRGALQHRHIRHRPNFDLGIHALIDIVEQTNCWQKAECKEWSSFFGNLCPIITR